MDGLEINKKTFNEYYDKPAWWFKIRYDTQYKKKTCLHILSKNGFFAKNKKILEIGFGCGETLLSFSKAFLYGVEISDSAINFVNKNAKNKKIDNIKLKKLTDNNELPYSDNKFDMVIASHVIEHVEDDESLIIEIKRVLTQKGYCLFLIPINEKYHDPNHLRKYNSNMLMSLIEKNDFSVVDYFENEYFFHSVEYFYHNNLNTKWKIFGPIIVLLFNLPLVIIPYKIIIKIEGIFKFFKFLPRQSAILVKKERKNE